MTPEKLEEIFDKIEAKAEPASDKLLARVGASKHSWLVLIAWTVAAVLFGWWLA